MKSQNSITTALFGAFVCLSLVGFSDTALGQVISVDNSTINLVVPAGGSSSAPLHVSTNNSTTVLISTTSQSWLSVSPSSFQNISSATPLTLTVAANLAGTGFATGSTASGTFSISVPGSQQTPITVTVNIQVGISSVLSANPSSLSFAGQQGSQVGSPSSIPVHISSSAAQLSYTLSTTTNDGGSWLLINPLACTTLAPCTTAPSSTGFTVTVNPTGLAASTTPYQGTITAQSTTSLDSIAIPVTLTVNAGPTISVTPTTLPQFLYQVSTATLQPASGQQTLNVSSTGGPVNFTVTDSPSVAWLVLGTNNGTTGTQPVPVTLNINKSGIPAITGTSATFSTSITITPASGPTPPPIIVSLVVSNNPLLSVSNNSLVFSAPFAGPATTTQQVTLTSTGGNVGFTVAQDTNAPWLSVSPLNGTVKLNLAGELDFHGESFRFRPFSPVGPYTGNIIVSPSNGDQYTIPIAVSLQVGAASQLTAGPPLLHFSYEIGKNAPGSQLVAINSSSQPVPFSVTVPAITATATCPANWLSATPLSGMTPAQLSVSITPAGMLPGTCTGTLTVMPTSGGGGQPLTIAVTVDVSNSAELNVSLPTNFGVQSVAQGAGTSTFGIQMTSTDPTTQVQFSVTSNQSWLFVTSNLATATPAVLSVIVSPSSPTVLTPGVYNGTITITSGTLPSGSISIPYALTVTPNVSVTVTPTGTLSFTQAQGGPVPPSQNVTLTSTGGSASFTAQVIPITGGNWLTLSTQSGTISTSGTLTASINPTVANTLSASANPYTSQISLAFPGTSTPPITLNVNLTVTTQTLTVTPQTLSFSYQVGGSTPASQPITVSTTGPGVSFTVTPTSTGNWLSVDATSGTTPKTINVSVNPANLPLGTMVGTPVTGTISIYAASLPANPTVVTVTVTTVAPPTPQPSTIANSGSGAFGGIAPGELITIKGSLLGPATPASFTVNSQGTVNSTLSGVQVLFDGTPGTPTYVSSNQINVIVPYEVAGRIATNVVVTYQMQSSAPIPQTVVSVAPSIYTLTADGKGQAAAYNVADGKINGPAGGVTVGSVLIPTEPAPKGSYIAVYGTGGGQTDPASTTGSVTSTLQPLHGWTATSGTVTATIGGLPATVTFAGAAPGLITGVVQYDIQIPAGASSGSLPLVITVDGVSTPLSGGATVAVQ